MKPLRPPTQPTTPRPHPRWPHRWHPPQLPPMVRGLVPPPAPALVVAVARQLPHRCRSSHSNSHSNSHSSNSSHSRGRRDLALRVVLAVHFFVALAPSSVGRVARWCPLPPLAPARLSPRLAAHDKPPLCHRRPQLCLPPRPPHTTQRDHRVGSAARPWQPACGSATAVAPWPRHPTLQCRPSTARLSVVRCRRALAVAPRECRVIGAADSAVPPAAPPPTRSVPRRRGTVAVAVRRVACHWAPQHGTARRAAP